MRAQGDKTLSSRETRVTVYGNRLQRLKDLTCQNGLDGMVLVPGPNLRYFTSVTSFLLERPFLFFAPRAGQPHLVAPKLESGPFLKSPVDMVIHSWDDAEGPTHAIDEVARQLSFKRKWGVEGRTPYQYLRLLLEVARPVLEDAEPVLQAIRIIKDGEEIKLLQRASTILSHSFTNIPKMLRVGMSETELARQILSEIERNGADTGAEVLVQSGAMAADAHHLPSPKKIRRKESIVVDATCKVSGYFADITRTFIIGRDASFEQLYNHVLDAQTAAINASKKGVTVGSIDFAARSLLTQNGLGPNFIHRTGHGLGLEVHEAPFIVPEGTEPLLPSMVFTVEPGVYVRDKIGVRIEDDLLVTEQGRKLLTKSVPKEYEWWR